MLAATSGMVASAGWMNATAIPEDAIPALVEALGDPEIQVRANCAHALARLDAIPAAAIPLLIECTADANDGLRMNAAMALKLAPAGEVLEVMRRLVADPNSRVRLIAAGSLLPAESSDAVAGAVLMEAMGDPAPRVREAARELLESLGAGGAAFVAGSTERSSPMTGGIARCRRAADWQSSRIAARDEPPKDPPSAEAGHALSAWAAPDNRAPRRSRPAIARSCRRAPAGNGARTHPATISIPPSP